MGVFAAGGVIAALAIVGADGCGPLAKQATTTAVDLAITVCVAEHADLPPADLKTVCHYADAQEPQAEEIRAAAIRSHARIILAEIRASGLRLTQIKDAGSD